MHHISPAGSILHRLVGKNIQISLYYAKFVLIKSLEIDYNNNNNYNNNNKNNNHNNNNNINNINFNCNDLNNNIIDNGNNNNDNVIYGENEIRKRKVARINNNEVHDNINNSNNLDIGEIINWHDNNNNNNNIIDDIILDDDDDSDGENYSRKRNVARKYIKNFHENNNKIILNDGEMDGKGIIDWKREFINNVIKPPKILDHVNQNNYQVIFMKIKSSKVECGQYGYN